MARLAREEQLREERRQRAEEARQLREEQDREYQESLSRDQRALELASARREAARKLPAAVTKEGTSR